MPSVEQLEQLTNFSKSTGNKEEGLPDRRVVAIPDNATNTVMLYGDLVEVERLAEALRSMDQHIQACHLKTWVVFVRADRQKGFDVLAKVVAGTNSLTTASLGGGVFNMALGVEHLQLSLNASNTRGQLEIVDQPYMQLIHGTTSSISTLEEIAIPTTTLSQGVAETSIEFKQVGLTIEVTPWFLDGERVRLQVDQKNGVIGATRTIAGNDIPEISTQSLKTSAELRMGQVLVLGGVESVQRERQKGWLTKKDVRKVGHLYIVAAVYSTVPKAIPVIDLEPDMPLNPLKPLKAVPVAPFLDDGPKILPKLELWKPERKQPSK